MDTKDAGSRLYKYRPQFHCAVKDTWEPEHIRETPPDACRTVTRNKLTLSVPQLLARVLMLSQKQEL